MKFLKHASIGIALMFASHSAIAATVSFTDIIPDGDRDYFYGFENLPYYNLGSTVSDGNITVTQINGTFNDITTAHLPGGGEGNHGWYPNGGDFGYTSISTTDGTDLTALGLLSGSGTLADRNAYYSLRLDGIETASGSYINSHDLSYVGFSGARFDEIWLISSHQNNFVYFGDNSYNALAIDAIEMIAAVPLPASLPLLFGALAIVGGVSRRRTRKS